MYATRISLSSLIIGSYTFDLKQAGGSSSVIEFIHRQMRDNEVYAEAGCQFSIERKDVLMNAQFSAPNSWDL